MPASAIPLDPPKLRRLVELRRVSSTAKLPEDWPAELSCRYDPDLQDDLIMAEIATVLLMPNCGSM